MSRHGRCGHIAKIAPGITPPMASPADMIITLLVPLDSLASAVMATMLAIEPPSPRPRQHRRRVNWTALVANAQASEPAPKSIIDTMAVHRRPIRSDQNPARIDPTNRP